MKKIHKSILILVTFLIFLLLCILYSEGLFIFILDYSKLFLTKVFPASFVFYILSSLLIEYGIIQVLFHLFHINTSSFYVFVLSLISGFPSGAKYTKELLEKELISFEEANQIIRFSHFPNPLFVTGVVSSVLKSSNVSFKILLAIIFSNILLFLFRKKSTKNNSSFKTEVTIPNFSNVLSKVIYQSFHILVLIYGTSLFFNLISFFLIKLFSFNSFSFVFISGLFDLTKGVFSTSVFSNTFLQALFIIFFISFGGISIHMQVLSILSNTGISYKNFFIGRIIGTILAILFFIFFWII